MAGRTSPPPASPSSSPRAGVPWGWPSTVVRLRGDRVDLSIELLHQEVERPTRGTAALEDEGELGEVGAEPRQLLLYVRLLRPDRDFGEDAPLLHPGVAEEGADPLAEPRLVARHRRGHARGHDLDVSLEVGPEGGELGGERLALGRAAQDQLVERLADRVGQDGPRRLRRRRVELVEPHHARTLEEPRQRHVAGDAEGKAELPRP